MTTYIIGHIKPDLDATVAPLATQFLLKASNCKYAQNSKPVIAGPVNNETTTIFNKFSVDLPDILKKENITTADRFILVDHNEVSHRMSGISNDQIVKIIDHHKVVVSMSTPIGINTKPWGSTCTVIWKIMKNEKVKPDAKLASLMISAILSDTVGLKSSTTTDQDKIFLEELNQIAKITDLDQLTLEILKAKSDISALTPKQIVTNDYKIFDFNGKKVLINQVETVEQHKVLSKKSELLKAMKIIKEEQSLDYIFVAVSDILKINTKMISLTPQGNQLLEKAFNQKSIDNIIDIGTKLSRKKEFAPAIEKALS